MNIFTCYLLMNIKNLVNIWWNEKYLVPLQQKTRNNKFNNLKDQEIIDQEHNIRVDKVH